MTLNLHEEFATIVTTKEVLNYFKKIIANYVEKIRIFHII